jgi:Fructose-bisphosphate aldolase class-II
VFHGSSGSSAQELADALSFGVVKVKNVDTDNEYAFTRALGGPVLDDWRRCSSSTEGSATSAASTAGVGTGREAAMGERVRQACEQLGIRGPQPRRRPVIGPARRIASTESVGVSAPSPGCAAGRTVPVPPYG